MNKRYKIVLYNSRFYREIELAPGRHRVSIGMERDCDVQLDRGSFFEEFRLDLTCENDAWRLECAGPVYFVANGVTKLYSRELEHGDDLALKYEDSRQEIFQLSFMLDFDFETKRYDRVIDVTGAQRLSLGGSTGCEIYLPDELMGSGVVTLQKQGGKFLITDNGTRYGVYVNGRRIKEAAEVGDFDFFSVIGYSFYLKYGKLYTDSRGGLQVFGLPTVDVPEQNSRLHYPRFNRSTRLKLVVPEEEIPILDPPAVPQKPASNLIMSLLPALGMIAVTVLLRGSMGGGGSFILFSVASVSIGILTTIISLIKGRRDYKKSLIERREKYTAYINDKREEIEQRRREELAVLEETYFSLRQELQMVGDFSGDLFNRRYGDDDFLHVRLGTGAVATRQPVGYKKQEKLETEDDLAVQPERLFEEYAHVPQAPVVVDLFHSDAVGVVGEPAQLYEMLKILTLDLCVRHYERDVKLFFLVEPEHASAASWARLLPHVQNPALPMRNIVCDDESKTAVFEYLFKELSDRETNKRNTPNFVVLVFDEMGIKRHPVSRYIDRCSDLGVTFVFFEQDRELLPGGCRRVVTLRKNEAAGTVVNSADSSDSVDFAYECVDDATAANAAQRLAPVFCEEVSLESTLTKNISLYELLDVRSAGELDLGQRWSTSQVYRSMAAPLGVRTKNGVVALDLHEKAHGPHGLVAGTTGSGKSEILQSYILSMATLFHPYEVSFVIIDFKGGGMVNQFRELPHLTGAITNIDGREIERSLLSIKAELTKRQSLFAQYDVNHIDKYIQKYKAGKTKQPLPHLILIVDEFAELKAEQPDFMKELISAARIGRSLGVHLILATQKPSGVVDDQIWSNSRFKLCLKVQNKEDSNEVLKSPLAAEIKEPGRAYLQVGNNEIFELFQSAYSGCPAAADTQAQGREYSLAQVDLSGRKTVVFRRKKEKAAGNSPTQLEELVRYVGAYCEQQNIEKLPDICLPPLGESIDFPPEAFTRPEGYGIFAPLGLYDDPQRQYQGMAEVELSAENVLIIGSAQFGKTNLLQGMIRTLAARYSPEELNLYILDFGSMVLRNFEGLKHVGGVVCSSEDEKLKNFFKLMSRETARRKEKLLQVGVSSFLSYKEAGYTDLPQIVVLVDNLTALRELYLQEDDGLLVLCREGLAVGVSLVVANSQTSGIGYKYLSNFSYKIALYCNDSGEYGSLFDYCRMRPKETPGRCLLKREKELYECQTYLAFHGEKEIDRVREAKAFLEQQNARWQQNGARRIPEIPKLLTSSYAEKQFPEESRRPHTVLLGLDYETVSPVSLDLSRLGALGVTGSEKSGKGNFVRRVLKTLEKSRETAPVRVCIFDEVRRKYSDLSSLSIVERYTLDAQQVQEVLKEWHGELAARFDALMAGDVGALETAPLLLLVAQSPDVAEIIGKDMALQDLYKEMLTRYKGMKFCVIFSGLPNEAISYNAPEPLKMLKEAKNILAFSDLSEFKPVEVPYSAVKQFKKPVERGDAYLLQGSSLIKVKTVLQEL